MAWARRFAEHFGGRTALITGGASGIGAALGQALAGAGATVILADRDLAGAQAMATRCGGATRAVELDVRDRDAFRACVADVIARDGALDFLFNNAGIAVIGNVLKMDDHHWDDLVDINIRGVHNGVQAAYPAMVEQGHGHIVNTASAAGLLPVPGFTGYAMTKHAVVGLSVSLRYEAEQYGVKVSAVCPGVINTNMAESARRVGEEGRLKDEVPNADERLPTAAYCAEHALRGVVRGRPVIPVTAMARVGWALYRLWPALVTPIARRGRDLLAPR